VRVVACTNGLLLIGQSRVVANDVANLMLRVQFVVLNGNST